MRIAVRNLGPINPSQLDTPWWDAGSPLDGVNFTGGANTTLADGNLGLGRAGPIDPQTSTDRHAVGFARDGGTDFAVYDVAIQWDALETGFMRIGFNTGVKAVRADIDTESNSAEFTPGTMTAIPVIGTDIRFRITDRFHIGAGAATQAIDAAGEMLDLKAEAAVKFSPKIGFTFGYQIMRSAIDAGPFDATLTQEGAFARIQIKF